MAQDVPILPNVTPAEIPAPAPLLSADENKWLAQYDDDKHAPYVEHVLSVNPDLPEDLTKVAAVVNANGCGVEKIFFKIWRAAQKERTDTPLGVLYLKDFKIGNICDIVRQVGDYKATMHARWKHGGVLRIHRFSLEPAHFAQMMPQVSTVPAIAAANAAQQPGAAAGMGGMLEKMLVEMFSANMNKAAEDPIAKAKNLLELARTLSPAAPAGVTPEQIEDIIARKLSALSPEPANPTPWDKILGLLERQLPAIVQAFNPGPRHAQPGQSVNVSQLGNVNDSSRAQPGESVNVSPAAAVPDELTQIARVLAVGVSANAAPDAYAALVADMLRLQGEATVNGFMEAPAGTWGQILKGLDPKLADSGEWLSTLEEMVRGEFTTDEAPDDGTEPAQPSLNLSH